MKQVACFVVLIMLISFAPYNIQAEETYKRNIDVPQGAGPFPVIIYSHGSGGLGNAPDTWKNIFLDSGFATIFIDHYTPRGYDKSPKGRSRWPLNLKWRKEDLVSALKEVKADSRLDSSRITLAGGSAGANLPLIGVLNDDVREGAGLSDSIKAAILLYPSIAACVPRISSDFFEIKPIELPLLYLVGSEDPLIRACWDDMLSDIKSSDHPQIIKIYQGAKHAFDVAKSPRPCRTYRFRGSHEMCSVYDEKSFQKSVIDVKNFLSEYAK